jgi:hypothetical protein
MNGPLGGVKPSAGWLYFPIDCPDPPPPPYQMTGVWWEPLPPSRWQSWLASCFATTSMDPRNLTHVARASFAWFIFNLNTESYYFTDHTLQYWRIRQCLLQPNPLLTVIPCFTYLENQLLCSWCEYPSTLVPGLLTTAPPFARAFTPHRSSFNIYIDDINNNTNCPCPKSLSHGPVTSLIGSHSSLSTTTPLFINPMRNSKLTLILGCRSDYFG